VAASDQRRPAAADARRREVRLVTGSFIEQITDVATRLPVVLAALVIASAHAQTRASTPAKPGAQAAGQVHFPERLDWQKKKPEEVGMDSALIAEAVKIAIAAEAQTPREG
jgi:hypothetical protein